MLCAVITEVWTGSETALGVITEVWTGSETAPGVITEFDWVHGCAGRRNHGGSVGWPFGSLSWVGQVWASSGVLSGFAGRPRRGRRRVTTRAVMPAVAVIAKAAAIPVASGQCRLTAALMAAPPMPMPIALPRTSARLSDADAQPSRPAGAAASISNEIGE